MRFPNVMVRILGVIVFSLRVVYHAFPSSFYHESISLGIRVLRLLVYLEIFAM